MSASSLPLRFRIARWVMRRRAAVGIAFILVTLAFAAGIPEVQIRTIFRDLLPRDDPFVQVYFDHPNFGNPMLISVMVKVKQGDIYNSETLAKVWQMTRDLDLAPYVNHDTLISIATEKARYAEATPDGVDLQTLMGNAPPSTPEELAALRANVSKAPGMRAFYISQDETATLINVAFWDYVEYGEAFAFVQDLVEKNRDARHEIHVAGLPMLTGWVYKLQRQTYTIFGVTLGLLLLALLFYMRNVSGIVTPVVCAAVAGLWGFGLIGWLARPIEPLLMIVPLLLVARSMSHCVQYTERYYELLVTVKDRVKAAELTLGVMMVPSILGIVTDVFGIVFIAIAPIKTMVNHAIFCGFWAVAIIPTGVFLISILLSYLPIPRNIRAIAGDGHDHAEGEGIHEMESRLLSRVADLSVGRFARLSSFAVVLLALAAVWTNAQLKIGNPVEGSNLLWSDSEYNTAVRALNAHFPGMNTLEIVLEAKEIIRDRKVARTPEVMQTSMAIQRMMESDSAAPPRATLSFSDYMREMYRLFSGGHMSWRELDPTEEAVATAGFVATFGTSPDNYATVSDYQFQNSSVSVWYPDNRQETVDAALASARRAVAAVGEEHQEFRVRLGTGVIALQQATNEVIHRYHWLIVGLVNLAVFLMAALAYRSAVAGLILLVPVNLSNFLLGSSMYLLGVGLDINATIVAVMGVGVGIDYGIYLLSRICEEYLARERNLEAAIRAALRTTGKAILFTATTMLLGIVPWYFLSDLKFMADMGLLLVGIMIINMLLSLIVLPLVVAWVRPRFLDREDLAVGEAIDPSLLAQETR